MRSDDVLDELKIIELESKLKSIKKKKRNRYCLCICTTTINYRNN